MTQAKKEYVQYLLVQYLTQKSTHAQEAELFAAVQERDDDEDWSLLLEELLVSEEEISDENREEWQPMVDKILQDNRKSKVRTLSRPWIKWVAAASIIAVLSIGYLVYNKTPQRELATMDQSERFKNDVPPGHEGAVLRLAGGEEIVLDNAADGNLAAQGNTSIKKQGGQVIYDDARGGNTSIPVRYNTMSTQRGRTYSLVMADGSRAWLNAASSITFPTAFTGSERRVEVTGEVYFEIASLPLAPSGGGGTGKKPFIVTVNGIEVQVLGTHFNVNAYSDEGDTKVTLLEGSVKVASPSPSGGGEQRSIVLKPGEQAKVKPGSPLGVGGVVDVEEVMAWKNGLFRFRDATIESLMKQIERWYDVEIEFKGKVNQHFITTIPRSVPLTQVLKYLETTGSVKFVIEGKKITVLP